MSGSFLSSLGSLKLLLCVGYGGYLCIGKIFGRKCIKRVLSVVLKLASDVSISCNFMKAAFAVDPELVVYG